MSFARETLDNMDAPLDLIMSVEEELKTPFAIACSVIDTLHQEHQIKINQLETQLKLLVSKQLIANKYNQRIIDIILVLLIITLILLLVFIVPVENIYIE
jgi:uncharacterized protein (DUF2164 family)